MPRPPSIGGATAPRRAHPASTLPWLEGQRLHSGAERSCQGRRANALHGLVKEKEAHPKSRPWQLERYRAPQTVSKSSGTRVGAAPPRPRHQRTVGTEQPRAGRHGKLVLTRPTGTDLPPNRGKALVSNECVGLSRPVQPSPATKRMCPPSTSNDHRTCRLRRPLVRWHRTSADTSDREGPARSVR